MSDIPTILFIGTTNTSRSRFAEALFNHHAELRELGWCAFSRGVSPAEDDEEHLSPHTRSALETRSISQHHTATTKAELTEDDFEIANLVIGLCEREHRTMLDETFPDWVGHCNFWEVEKDEEDPEAALELIDEEINALIEELAAAEED